MPIRTLPVPADNGEVVLANGLVTIPVAALLEMLNVPPTKDDIARAGVIVANDRAKVMILAGEGADRRPIEYTLSVYVQRSPLTDEESAACMAVKADGETKKAKRDADEQAKREREIDAACRRTQSTVLTNLQNIGSLTAAADGIAQHYAGKMRRVD